MPLAEGNGQEKETGRAKRVKLLVNSACHCHKDEGLVVLRG